MKTVYIRLTESKWYFLARRHHHSEHSDICKYDSIDNIPC